MNETEKEALQNILFALFLESPKRKASLQEHENVLMQKHAPVLTNKQRKYRTGETHNG